ncbi:MAG: hypothetical protein HGA37_15190, partial [Lentimicrobium sp.]|nr:hypothetical protein [Lentimicrobium sp.]
GSEAAWFAFLLTILNALIFQYSFVFRPEIMVMTLGFVSYLFLEKSLVDNKNNAYLIISGLFAGLAAATHLNGLIFMAAGGFLLLWKRNFKGTLIFALSTIPAFAIYFYDFTGQYGINYWLYQVNDSPALHKSTILPSSLAFLGKMLNEHLRFFHSPKEISFSLLFLFMLIVNFRNLKSEDNSLKYLLLLVVFLSLLAVHSTSKYILLYLPYIMLIVIRSFFFFYKNRLSQVPLRFRLTTRNAYNTSFVLISLFLITNMAWNIDIALKKFDPEKNRQLAKKYMGMQTSRLNILAPMTFIFNEIEHFNRIQSDLSITEMNKAGKSYKGLEFLSLAESLELDYLIITDDYRSKFGLDSMKTADFVNSGYIISGKETGITILKREHRIVNE